ICTTYTSMTLEFTGDCSGRTATLTLGSVTWTGTVSDGMSPATLTGNNSGITDCNWPSSVTITPVTPTLSVIADYQTQLPPLLLGDRLGWWGNPLPVVDLGGPTATGPPTASCPSCGCGKPGCGCAGGDSGGAQGRPSWRKLSLPAPARSGMPSAC